MSFELTKLIPVKTAAKLYAEHSNVVSREHHKGQLKVWSNYKAYVDWAQIAIIAITICASCWDKKKAKSFYYGKKFHLVPMVKASLGALFLVKIGKIVAVYFKTYHKIMAEKAKNQLP